MIQAENPASQSSGQTIFATSFLSRGGGRTSGSREGVRKALDHQVIASRVCANSGDRYPLYLPRTLMEDI